MCDVFRYVVADISHHTGFVDARVVAEEPQNLIARPMLPAVNSGVDHQPNRAQHLVVEATVVVVGIVVESDLLPQSSK